MFYSLDHSQLGASIHSFETSTCLLFLSSLSSDFLSFPSFPPFPRVSLAPLLPPALHLGLPLPALPHHLTPSLVFSFSFSLTGLVLPPPLLLPRPLVTSAPPPTSCTTTPGKYIFQYSFKALQYYHHYRYS